MTKMSSTESERRQKQSWRAKGYTMVPNVLMSKAFPPNVRCTAMELYARGFGGRQGVCVSVETVAKAVGFSRQTVQKHFSVLELAGVIRRIRRGQRYINVIVLTLKAKAEKLAESIEKALPGVRDVVLTQGKRTMGWWMEHWRANKESRRCIGMSGWVV